MNSSSLFKKKLNTSLDQSDCMKSTKKCNFKEVVNREKREHFKNTDNKEHEDSLLNSTYTENNGISITDNVCTDSLPNVYRKESLNAKKTIKKSSVKHKKKCLKSDKSSYSNNEHTESYNLYNKNSFEMNKSNNASITTKVLYDIEHKEELITNINMNIDPLLSKRRKKSKHKSLIRNSEQSLNWNEATKCGVQLEHQTPSENSSIANDKINQEKDVSSTNFNYQVLHKSTDMSNPKTSSILFEDSIGDVKDNKEMVINLNNDTELPLFKSRRKSKEKLFEDNSYEEHLNNKTDNTLNINDLLLTSGAKKKKMNHKHRCVNKKQNKLTKINITPKEQKFKESKNKISYIQTCMIKSALMEKSNNSSSELRDNINSSGRVENLPNLSTPIQRKGYRELMKKYSKNHKKKKNEIEIIQWTLIRKAINNIGGDHGMQAKSKSLKIHSKKTGSDKKCVKPDQQILINQMQQNSIMTDKGTTNIEALKQGIIKSVLSDLNDCKLSKKNVERKNKHNKKKKKKVV